MLFSFFLHIFLQQISSSCNITNNYYHTIFKWQVLPNVSSLLGIQTFLMMNSRICFKNVNTRFLTEKREKFKIQPRKLFIQSITHFAARCSEQITWFWAFSSLHVHKIKKYFKVSINLTKANSYQEQIKLPWAGKCPHNPSHLLDSSIAAHF